MRLSSIGLCLCGVLGLAGSASAAVIAGDGADYNARVRYDNSTTPSANNATNGLLTVGLNASGTNALIASAVFYYPLPTQASIGTAELSFYLSSMPNLPTANVDVYGLGYVATPTADINLGMVYESPVDPDNDTRAGVGIPNVTKIEDNFFTSASTVAQFQNTSPAGNTALLGFLNSLYANGAVAGNFAIIRLNVDSKAQSSGTAWSYQVSSANRTTVTERPYMTVEVPEPASLAILGMAGCALMIRRRRA